MPLKLAKSLLLFFVDATLILGPDAGIKIGHPPYGGASYDFDTTDPDVLTIKRKVSIRKGSWYQLPKGIKRLIQLGLRPPNHYLDSTGMILGQTVGIVHKLRMPTSSYRPSDN